MEEVVRETFKTQYPHLTLYADSKVEWGKEDGKTLKLFASRKIKNLWFIGGVGTGKTTKSVHLIMRMLESAHKEDLASIKELQKKMEKAEDDSIERAVMERHVETLKSNIARDLRSRFYFVNVPKLLLEIESHRFDPQFSIPSPDVVVLDDMGWEIAATPYVIQYFGVWVEERYGADKQNIITSNFSLDALAKKKDFINIKTIDRLTDAKVSKVVKMEGKSFRRQK